MDVLVIGGGGREHAIVWKVLQSPRAGRVVCAPGNGGIAQIAECVDIKATDIDGIVGYAKKEKFDLVIVAPDDPLAMGMVDALEAVGIRAFGPRKDAAVIEASKSFAKDLMDKYGIPTAKYRVFDNIADAREYISSCPYPAVVKADGLALGKGVFICENQADAENSLHEIFEENKFGKAGSRVVIEEFLVGPEVSVLAFTDGKTLRTMPSAQDHKRAFDGDQGPNTGGMGAFSPSRNYSPEIADTVYDAIMLPTIRAMEKEGRLFQGVLYFGLMLTQNGPKVLEYNARFGDPETQAILPLLENDLLDIIDAVIDKRLDEVDLQIAPKASACVVIASGGYPGSYQSGKRIDGLEDAQKSGALVFHAGSRLSGEELLTNGGRVLGVTATGDTLDDAISQAYKACGFVSFDDMFYRNDIGRKKV